METGDSRGQGATATATGNGPGALLKVASLYNMKGERETTWLGGREPRPRQPATGLEVDSGGKFANGLLTL